MTTLSPADAERKRGSAGRPLLTTHVRIADGEILVQGPTVAPGAADEDGWLHTGDSGRIDAEGFLWVEGRRDDVIVTGGENVAPEEVEEVLAAHPDVVEAAVVGRPDPDWQNAVVAVVVAARRRHARARGAAQLVRLAPGRRSRSRRASRSPTSCPAPARASCAAPRCASFPRHGRCRFRRGNLLRRRRGPLGPRGQDRRHPRLRLPGPRPRAQPEGLRRRRGGRAAAGLLEPRGRRGRRTRGPGRRRRRQPRRRRDDPAARREAGRGLERGDRRRDRRRQPAHVRPRLLDQLRPDPAARRASTSAWSPPRARATWSAASTRRAAASPA